jgi:20S proteasome alpha/beta subunit
MIQLSSVEVPSNMLIHSSPGTGAVYSFDPVGSYEREACRAAGAAQSLVQPFLDNQVSSRP